MKNHIRQLILFGWQGVKDRNVASVVPTYSGNVKKICEEIPKHRPINVLEYGPGTGPFTQYLLENLHPDSKIIALDRNAQFVSFLKEMVQRKQKKDKPFCEIIEGDAIDAPQILKDRGINKIDYGFSGIPLSYLSDPVKQELIKRTFELLKPGGSFIVYQVSMHALPYLKAVFPRVDSSVYWMNIPPLSVMKARK